MEIPLAKYRSEVTHGLSRTNSTVEGFNLNIDSPGFTFRGLEMHGPRMWRADRLFEALEFANSHEMTALVLHDNTIMHDTTFPRKYFDDAKRKGYAQVRRHQNGIYSKQYFLRDLLKQAGRRNIEVWVEIKELEFPDEVLEKFPQLIKDGVICPTDPIWLEYLQIKTEEFFDLFPEIAGVIVSPGSPESRAYLSAGKKCSCDRCQAMDFGDWCRSIIMSMYSPIRARGKKLAIRDFVYSPSDHERLSKIITRIPEDIIFCIKAMPRDFWPTFPDNPMIGRFQDRVQWVEYDVFGQFFGWGVCPSLTLEDMKNRFTHAKTQGVSGVLLRTEWENVIDLSCFDNLNKIILIAGAQMGKDLATPFEQSLATWLREDFSPGDAPESQVDLAGLTRFLLKTWPIMEKTIYIDGFVFATCSRFPLNIDKAWFTMNFYHSLAAWDPTKANRLSLDYPNLQRLIAEKDEALQMTQAFLAELDRNDLSLPEALYQALKEAFQYYDQYVRGFVACAKVCLLSKAIETGVEIDSQRRELIRQLAQAMEVLSAYIRELERYEAETSHPYYVYLLLDYRSVQGILDQARQILSAQG